MADETANAVAGEVLRSAFAISAQHVLTAWHCIRDIGAEQSLLWFRLRNDDQAGRTYVYVPVRLTNVDRAYDVAALAVDEQRLDGVQLTSSQAAAILSQLAVPLAFDIQDSDQVQVMGFPESASSADSDTNSATVVDTNLPLGDVSGIKLYGPSFGAVSPVNPHGMSGGPVLRHSWVGSDRMMAAVGVIRVVPIGTIGDAASGGCLIATRIEDVTEHLPEVAVATQSIRQAAARLAPSARSRINTLAMSRACWDMLRTSVLQVDDPDLGLLMGWPHFFDEPLEHRRPTAIGTAYGLKLALTLGGHGHGLDRSRLAETLWKLRRPDGGWAARTGSGVSRPEVSALVLGALASSGFDAAHLSEAVSVLEAALSPGSDPEAMQRTNVVGAIMRGLLRSRPQSPLVAQLRTILLSGAFQDPAQDDLLCWASRLRTEGQPSRHPSTAHTAQAVVALVRAGQVLGDDGQSRNAVNQAVRWLRARQDLTNQTEQIRRFVEDNHPWETLTVRHFTAAWVARALLLLPPADPGSTDGLLSEAAHQVWRAYRGGLWEWDDGERPLWMSYQGASVLRDYAMHVSLTLP